MLLGRGAVIGLLLAAAALTAAASPADDPQLAEGIVSVSVNLEPKGDAYVLIGRDGEILMRESDLKAYGLSALAYRPTRIDGVAYVPLRGIPRLSYAFDEAKLILRIRVEPRAISRRQVIDMAPPRAQDVVYPSAGGAFLNYNLTGNGTDATGLGTLSAAGELGVRLGDYLLLADAQSSYRRDTGASRTTRLNTSLTRDWRDSMQRLVIGDFVTSASTLGSSLRLGGISFSRRYSIDPYYLRAPGQVVSGTAALPSDVYLYNNGVLIGHRRVEPGSFELQNLVSLNGLQVTEVVVRDVLGNEQTLTNPFYFTQALLREGLDEYSADVGLEREQFGVASNDYGKLGAAGFYRRGVSDALTLGVRGETLDRRYNLGPTASWRMGTWGVASAEVSWGASPDGGGSALALAHSFSSPGFASSLAWRTETRGYPRAGADTSQNRRHDLTGTVSMPIGVRSSIALIYQDTQPWDAGRSRSTSLTWRRRLSNTVYAAGTLRRADGVYGANEVLLSLSFNPVGDAEQPSYSAQLQRGGGADAQTLQVMGGNPDAEGLVYRATAQHFGGPGDARDTIDPYLQYNFARGVARGEYFRDSGAAGGSYQLGFAGAVARVGDAWGLSRPIYDSYGMVKVEGARNVRVYANNIEVGRTDAQGELFVPRLASYFDNPIAIEDKDLPADVVVPQTRYIVSPPLRSGVLVDFKARRVRAVVGRLMTLRGGKRVPFADAPGEIEVPGGKPVPAYAARDGSFYVEGLASGTYRGEVSGKLGRCAFTLRVPPSSEAVTDLGSLECAGAR